MRLFCFGHAGGGTVFFRPWRQPLLPDVEVCPVLLPGREARWGQLPYTGMAPLVEGLFREVFDRVDVPFALFGHSMGAAVAFAVARRFVESSGGGPVCLFVSGRQPPHVPLRRPPLHSLPEGELLARLAGLNGTPPQVLGEKELLRAFLPCLRADLELSETYVPGAGPLLSIPVWAFVGDRDPEVDPAEMNLWGELTSGEFGLRVFRGDHFYLKGARPEVFAAIREGLERAATSAAAPRRGERTSPRPSWQ